MNSSFFKHVLREMKATFSKFVSIFSIVAIGVAFFAGIKAAVPIMEQSADAYYDTYNLMDLRLLSTYGFHQEDIEAIRGIEGVEGVFATHSIDVTTIFDTKQYVLKVHGLETDLENDHVDAINQVHVVEGRLPQQSGECVIEESKMEVVNLKIGDRITLDSEHASVQGISLKTQEYTIVGTVQSPYYLSYEKGTSSIGSGKIDRYIMIPQSDFISPFYSEVFVTIKDTKALNSYKEAYFETVIPVKERLEMLGEKQSSIQQEKLQKLLGGNNSKGISQEGKWYVLDRKAHYSYMDYGNAAQKIDAISRVFPVFFFLVAALVCLTTMTRMVDEQRSFIGTMKALGYSRFMIAMKFLVYVMAASISGGIVGGFLGMWIFPTVIFNSWAIIYQIPEIQLQFQPLLAFSTILIAVCITTFATLAACYKELLSTPAILMRAKSPKAGKKIFLEHLPFLWKRLSFLQKVTARNVFRYKKRFLMTIIGIAGCSALLLSGFGIRDSISQVANKQYGEILKYDMSMQYTAGISKEAKESTFSKLLAYPEIESTMEIMQKNGTLLTDKESVAVSIHVPSSLSSFPEFVRLQKRGSKELLDMQQQGVFLSEKLAQDNNIHIGDTIRLNNGSGKEQEATVAGIFEFYIGHMIYMSPQTYTSLFQEDVAMTHLYAKLTSIEGIDQQVLGGQIMMENTISSLSFYTDVAKGFQDMISSLDIVVIVLIISAGLLAFVVLYNLTNVNISERIREIATIKVLGFYDREVSAYVSRENIILALIGAIVGLGLGVILHHFIITVAELDTVMFGRSIAPLSYLFSIIITMLFAIFVNIIVFKKLKKIPMVESLKSVE
ncbi:MAG: ABC transporter permease [Erysipelotrichaceae bacterium]|nr:ABC transporter permease [Erysipelotrichaceae bacterium]